MTRTQRLAIVIGVVVGLVAVFAFASCSGDDTAERSGEPAAHATTTAPPAATPGIIPTVAPTATPDGQPQYLIDDIYEVGREIRAGTYVTTAPDDRGCYWARLRAFTGSASDFIADHNLEPGESARVTVKASDAGFKVSNGCRWERAPLS